jgi:uncharacterized protein DUF3761
MDFNVRNALVAALCLALAPIGAQAKKTAKQEPADVQCKDGTTSKAGRGACSHHGGVAATTSAGDAQDRNTAPVNRSTRESQEESAEVQCKDGTTSKGGRGACSHHGGIAGMAPADEARNRKPARTEQESQAPHSPAPQARTPATAPQRAPPAGQPTARCKDGSLSYSQHRSGTCSRHGGVAEWLAR